MSDVHLEFGDLPLHNNQQCDVLVLAGDIVPVQLLPPQINISATTKYAHKFFQRATELFEHVVWVAGNHEFYENDWDRTLQQCRVYADQLGIEFCENRSVHVGSHTFVCATLWTDFCGGNPLAAQACTAALNDYKYIFTGRRRLHTELVAARHRESLEYMRRALAKTPRAVVVTHHAPSVLSIPQHFRNDLVSAAYCSDLSEFVYEHPQLELWLHGHTHAACDYGLHHARVVCNPRGYATYNERTDWNQELVIAV